MPSPPHSLVGGHLTRRVSVTLYPCLNHSPVGEIVLTRVLQVGSLAGAISLIPIHAPTHIMQVALRIRPIIGHLSCPSLPQVGHLSGAISLIHIHAPAHILRAIFHIVTHRGSSILPVLSIRWVTLMGLTSISLSMPHNHTMWPAQSLCCCPSWASCLWFLVWLENYRAYISGLRDLT